MGDQRFNNYLVVYIDKDNVANSIDNETISQQFQNMKTCRNFF